MTALFIIIAILEFIFIVLTIHSYLNINKKSSYNFIQKSRILLILQFVGIAFINFMVINNPEKNFLEVFKSINYTFKTIGFEVANNDLIEYLNKNIVYNISYFFIHISYIIGFYFSVIVTLFEKWINVIRNNQRIKTAKQMNCDILIGMNDAKPFINSYLSDKNPNYRIIVWDSNLTEEDEKWLFSVGIPFAKKSFSYETLLDEQFEFDKDNVYNFISFNDETVNIKYVSEFIKFISSKKNNEPIYKTEKFYLNIEIGLENKLSIQDKILSYREEKKVTVSPFILFFNRYELDSLIFSEKYPITNFMPEGFIDYTKAAIINDSHNIIKPFNITVVDKEINVISDKSKMVNVLYLGFGKISRELYRVSVMNNQIPSYEEFYTDGKLTKIDLTNHLVNYFAFDSSAFNMGDKNNIYYVNRINSNLFKHTDLKYFTPLERTHRFYACNCDINMDEIVDDIVKICKGDNRYSSIIISLGSDLDNLDYALKVNLLFKQLNIANYHIFVRIKNQTEELEQYLNEHFTFFGSEEEVLNHNVIVNDNLNALAHIVDDEYNAKKLSEDSWYSKPSIEHKSSIYSALNFRLKLQLLGYNYVDGFDTIEDKFKEKFLSKVMKKGKDYREYLFFTKEPKESYSAIEVLSFQEHSRWDAFYTFHGYIPMSYSTLYRNNEFYKKDHELKLHMCLIPYEELDIYHNLCAMISFMSKYSNDEKELEFLYSVGINQELIKSTLNAGSLDENGNVIYISERLVEILKDKEKTQILYTNTKYLDIISSTHTYQYDYNLVEKFDKILFESKLYKLIKK